MNLTELHIDDFGAWHDLRLEGLAPGLNVLYGPNEAGKTTLLNFVRSVLYGFSPERRTQYLSPLEGKVAGGWLRVDTPQGMFRVTRRAGINVTQPRGSVTIHTTDEGLVDGDLLETLLEQIDERTFEHVFALGLDEIQELRTLNDTAAAEQLYSLTIGIDRVSVAQVMRELAASRRHWLGQGDFDGQIGRLLAERSRLRTEIDSLADATTRYAHLVGEREDLGRQSSTLEQQIETLQQELQCIDVAATVRDKWAERARLDAQIAPLKGAADLPAGVMDRFETIQTGIRGRKQRWQKLRSARRKLRTEAKQIVPQRKLLDQAGRIHALSEQHEWVLGLERKIASLTTEQRDLERELEAQKSAAGLGDVSAELLKTVNVRSLAPLKSQARSLQRRREELEQARREIVPQAAIPAVASTPEQTELIAAAQEAGKKVSLLRRRVQLNQRLEQMAVQQQELEEQSGELADRQLLPLPLVMILGTVFVLGVVLVLAGWWLSFGWVVSVFGAAGIIGSVVMKYYLERSADQQLDQCDRQLTTLRQQMEQLKQQRKELDAEIPPGGGPMLARLEAAEAELARLEGLLPLEAQRKATEQTTIVTADRRQQTEQAYRDELRRWRQSLHAAGWPPKMSPKQVWQAARSGQQLRALSRRQQQLQDDVGLAQSALSSFTQRLRQLLADVGLMPASDLPAELIRQLRKELSEQEGLQSQRRELRRRDARYRRLQQRERRRAARLMRQRTRLVRELGAVDEADLRQRVAELALRSQLQGSRDAVQREIAAALGRQHSENSMRDLLESTTVAELSERRHQCDKSLEQAQCMLRERLERRGHVLHQMQLLADDRRLGQLQLELGEVEARLRQAIERWKALVVASRTMEAVRQLYERERQPEALQEASTWLSRLTSGRYTRVWTPLGEDRLLVDDAHGQSWHAGTFSRGTREQLFLALRLALVASYARRGVRLPMVLDDVLVNFDADRARAAAQVLDEFGAQGHQLLVFTCHEHLAAIFENLDVPVRQLPNRAGETVLPPVTLKRKSASRRKREPTPMIVVEPIAEPLAEEPVLQPPLPPATVIIVEPAAAEPPIEYEVAPPEVVEPAAPLVIEEEPPAEVATPMPMRRARRRKPAQARRIPLEASFVEYDGLFPWNEEPADAIEYYRDEPEEIREPWIEPRLATPALDELWSIEEQPQEADWVSVAEPWPSGDQKWVWIGGHWLGDGAEEFEGEFAVRPEPQAKVTNRSPAKESSHRRRAKRSDDDNDAEAA